MVNTMEIMGSIWTPQNNGAATFLQLKPNVNPKKLFMFALFDCRGQTYE